MQNSKIIYIDAPLKEGGPKSPVFSADEGWQLPSPKYGMEVRYRKTGGKSNFTGGRTDNTTSKITIYHTDGTVPLI